MVSHYKTIPGTWTSANAVHPADALRGLALPLQLHAEWPNSSPEDKGWMGLNAIGLHDYPTSNKSQIQVD